MKTLITFANRLWASFLKSPQVFLMATKTLHFMCEGFLYARGYKSTHQENTHAGEKKDGVLIKYFNAHEKGPGLWKWSHYFEAYERHLKKFVGRKPVILEIGVYSGGSMQMWAEYFGEGVKIIGVDIEDACKIYENEKTKIFVGDQADPNFWTRVKSEVPRVDIVIDDGGHTVLQQRTTIEQLLPILSPGGVFICEDVHGEFNNFSAFAMGMVHNLNQQKEYPDKSLGSDTVAMQEWVKSVHFYPYLVIVEKQEEKTTKLFSTKKGTDWQPFKWT